MVNPNTSGFWDKKIFEEKIKLLKSPIYIDKNRHVASLLRASKGKLLDLGFGYGMLEDLLSKHVTELDLFGMDISKSAVRDIRLKVDGKFIVGNAKKIPFGSIFFDYVVALDILEHFRINEINMILPEVRRVLRTGGIIIVSVPVNEGRKDSMLNKHMISFSKASISDLLEKYLFRVEKTKLLFAFRNKYFIKSLFARVFKIRKPNLIILLARKV